jgi:hypothetical protein
MDPVLTAEGGPIMCSAADYALLPSGPDSAIAELGHYTDALPLPPFNFGDDRFRSGGGRTFLASAPS